MFICNKTKLILSCLMVFCCNSTFGMDKETNDSKQNKNNSNSHNNTPNITTNIKKQNSDEIVTNTENINDKESKIYDNLEVIKAYFYIFDHERKKNDIEKINKILESKNFSEGLIYLDLYKENKKVKALRYIINTFSKYPEFVNCSLKKICETIVHPIKIIYEGKSTKIPNKYAKIIGKFVKNESNKKIFIDLVGEDKFDSFKKKI